jgi:NAD(P)-dependent dehydrogenase (short-subunit alcohol dehydrogenase family)
MLQYDFTGRVAVVTGTAGGMGQAVARGILTAGARWLRRQAGARGGGIEPTVRLGRLRRSPGKGILVARPKEPRRLLSLGRGLSIYRLWVLYPFSPP